MFRVSNSRWLINSVLALLVVALFTALLFLLRGVLTTPIVALLFLIPVVISAFRWGLVPGVVASFGAFLALNYFFLPPYYALAVHQSQDILALIVFLAVAVLISQLVGRIYKSLSDLRMREMEALGLYNFSLELSGLSREADIARLLATQLQEGLEAQLVDVTLAAEPPLSQVDARSPADGTLPAGPANVSLPIQSGRGALGDVRLWRDTPLQPPEERVLRTLTRQTGLALERAQLARVETRARILEESDRLKSALLSSVSHEFRTPLVTIKAAATGLRSGMVSWDSPAREELLIALEDESDRLNRLVDNLLSSSRLEAGALTLSRQWHFLLEIIDPAVDRMARTLQNYTLVIDVSEDLPLVYVDHVLIQQVFVNLLGNCAKYAPAGTMIGIAAETDGDNALLVRVTNEGPPVPEANLTTIFLPFQRLQTTGAPGLGLGLSICKGIIEAHGGSIWAVNLDRGLAFCFSLPLAPEGITAPHVPLEAEPA